MTEESNRKVYVPGISLEVQTIIVDKQKNSVIAVAHDGKVIVVFFSRQHGPSARVMTEDQARKFGKELLEAHQAINDDALIAQMEKEFE